LFDAGGRIVKSLLRGMANYIKDNWKKILARPVERIANLFGTSIYNDEDVSRETLDKAVMPTQTINEVNTNNTNTMKLEVTTKGDTKIDEENAEIIAQKLIPYVDQSLGRI
jgi:hypothetical protein